MQGIWSILLRSPDFENAFATGLVVCCGDGQWRRLFPCFFAYSADYVERYVQVYCISRQCESILSKRVLVACIKSNGKHLYATCKTTNEQVHGLGTKSHDQIYASRRRVDSESEQSRVDSARKKIYQSGYVADGAAIDKILRDSKTPIRVRSFLFLSAMQHLNMSCVCS